MDGADFSKWSCKEREQEHYSLGAHDIRRWYQRDIDQITHSTCFRKLQRKSQLLSEKDPRSRSRLIHTIEVSRIAMEISEKLGLSKELTEAICLAHDIGTSPYGYIGNSFLAEKAKKRKVNQEFSHEMAGAYMLLRISQKSTNSEEYDARIEALVGEKESEGTIGKVKVNISEFPGFLYASKISVGKDEPQYYLHHISPEILDGVYNHGESGKPSTLEGQVVQFADNIAYLSQDIEDIITTKMAVKTAYTKFAAEETLQYTLKSKKTPPKAFSMLWESIDGIEGLCSLKDAYSETRGRRIAAFVSRFVSYNLKQLTSNKLTYRKSEILGKDIPVLECDEGSKFVINHIWNYIEQQYKNTLIRTSNRLQCEKMNQLWDIISSEDFVSKNKSFRSFMNDMSNNSLFADFDKEWRKAFFISHLSWFDVDLIIDSYHERNNTFELDISY